MAVRDGIGLGGDVPGMAKNMFTTVKISAEAVRVAKIAASFRGQNLAEFVTSLILEQAPRIIAEGAASMEKQEKRDKEKGV
jgi:uncharacterized protein (DUF1778 family)